MRDIRCGNPAGLWYGEAAQALARNTDFEVPALRRTAARCQQQLQDLAKRRDEARASAVAAAAAFEQVGASSCNGCRDALSRAHVLLK